MDKKEWFVRNIWQAIPFFLPAFKRKVVSAEGIVQEGRENGTAIHQGRRKTGRAYKDTFYGRNRNNFSRKEKKRKHEIHQNKHSA
ncbi:hypothetical protein BLA28_20190 [Eisenbergiella tayi]|nr:hypothetical protein BLA28_20190 [Eisenbergiella tayi]